MIRFRVRVRLALFLRFMSPVNIKCNKAIIDHTSPALCTPVTPFPADPIFSKRGMIPCAA